MSSPRAFDEEDRSYPAAFLPKVKKAEVKHQDEESDLSNFNWVDAEVLEQLESVRLTPPSQVTSPSLESSSESVDSSGFGSPVDSSASDFGSPGSSTRQSYSGSFNPGSPLGLGSPPNLGGFSSGNFNGAFTFKRQQSQKQIDSAVLLSPATPSNAASALLVSDSLFPRRKNSQNLKVKTQEKKRGLAAQIKQEFEGEDQANYREFFEFIATGQSSWVNLLKQESEVQRDAERSEEEKKELQTQVQVIGSALLGPHISLEPSNQVPYYVIYRGLGDRPALRLSTRILSAFFSESENFLAVETLFQQKQAFLKSETDLLKSQKDQAAQVKQEFINLNQLIKKLKSDSDSLAKTKVISAALEKHIKKSKPAIDNAIQVLLGYFNNDYFNQAINLLTTLSNKLALFNCNAENATEAYAELFDDCYKQFNALIKAAEKTAAVVNNKREKPEALSPICLSLAVFQDKEGHGCWLMISNPEKSQDLFQKLHQFVANYTDSHFRVSLLNPASEDSQTHLQLVLKVLGQNHPPVPYRGCIEKTLTSLAVKKSFSDPHFQLLDVINFPFYPTSEMEKPSDQLVEVSVGKEKRWLTPIPCCINCQSNKKGFLALLGASIQFQKYRAEQEEKQEKLLRQFQAEALAALMPSTSSAPMLEEETEAKRIEKLSPYVTSPPEKSVAVCSFKPVSTKANRQLFFGDSAPVRAVSDSVVDKTKPQSPNIVQG